MILRIRDLEPLVCFPVFWIRVVKSRFLFCFVFVSFRFRGSVIELCTGVLIVVCVVCEPRQ